MKATRVNDNNTNGFNKTLKWVFLQMTSVAGNSNKFVLLELQENDNNEYRIYSETGRVGSDPAHWVRVGYSSLQSAESDFNKIVAEKTSGKRKDASGNSEAYYIVDVVSPSFGSDNIRSTIKTTTKNDVPSGLFQQIKDSQIRNLLNKLLKANKHSLSLSSNITFNVNGSAETAFGPVTLEHIQEAREILTNIKNSIKGKFDSISDVPASLIKMFNKYFSYIPRSFNSRKISLDDLILEDSDFIKEHEMLDQLEAVISINDTNDSEEIELPFTMEKASEKDSKTIIQAIEKSRKHRSLNEWKPVNVYKVEIKEERKQFFKKNESLKGEEIDLFHGTDSSNILAILTKGLIVPPVSAPNVTGRMFGNGIYAASSSTKALNYSAGYWNGSRHNDSIFMFVVRFSMGKVYNCKRALPSGTPKGYNSIFAQGGADLVNDEYIVPETSQCSIRYMVEFKKN